MMHPATGRSNLCSARSLAAAIISAVHPPERPRSRQPSITLAVGQRILSGPLALMSERFVPCRRPSALKLRVPKTIDPRASRADGYMLAKPPKASLPSEPYRLPWTMLLSVNACHRPLHPPKRAEYSQRSSCGVAELESLVVTL